MTCIRLMKPYRTPLCARKGGCATSKTENPAPAAANRLPGTEPPAAHRQRGGILDGEIITALSKPRWFFVIAGT